MWKPVEYWIAFAVGLLIVLERGCKARRGRVQQAVMAAISAGMGVSLSPTLAAWSGRSEVLVVMGVTAFGYPAVDIVTALLSDRDLWRQMIVQRLGGRDRR